MPAFDETSEVDLRLAIERDGFAVIERLLARDEAADETRGRRVIHLEFAAAGALYDGYEWHEFHRLAAA